MADVYVEWEDGWESKAFHFNSSLNPLGDAVREATDKIGQTARGHASAEAARWSQTRDTTRTLLKRNFHTEKLRYFRAKAMAYSLDIYVKTLRFTMERGGDMDFGRVGSYHAAGDRIEFGGTDPRIELGRTGQRLEYPAFGFLRRAMGG